MTRLEADILILCGDLTDYGLPEDAAELARVSGIWIPMVGVLGNHDSESGASAEIARLLSEAGVKVLDAETVEVHGIGFAGVKGFCGASAAARWGPGAKRPSNSSSRKLWPNR